jgi:hypothetical protein
MVRLNVFYAASDRASVVVPLLISAAQPPDKQHGVITQRKPLKWTHASRPSYTFAVYRAFIAENYCSQATRRKITKGSAINAL